MILLFVHPSLIVLLKVIFVVLNMTRHNCQLEIILFDLFKKLFSAWEVCNNFVPFKKLIIFSLHVFDILSKGARIFECALDFLSTQMIK